MKPVASPMSGHGGHSHPDTNGALLPHWLANGGQPTDFKWPLSSKICYLCPPHTQYWLIKQNLYTQ